MSKLIIVNPGRSGTTSIRNYFQNHPDVDVGKVKEIRYSKEYLKNWNMKKPFCFNASTPMFRNSYNKRIKIWKKDFDEIYSIIMIRDYWKYIISILKGMKLYRKPNLTIEETFDFFFKKLVSL